MTTTTKLRLTGRQYAALRAHLYPGDDREAVALAICGVGEWDDNNGIHRVICVFELIPVPYADCSVRTTDHVTWSTCLLLPHLPHMARRRQVLLKIHSHPTGFEGFSADDNCADAELFRSLSGWLDTDLPGLSAVMLPNGDIFARTVSSDGNFASVSMVAVAGSDILIWHTSPPGSEDPPDFRVRTAQLFGSGTTEKLSHLRVGVVGASGTGSPVTEMLYRLGVHELVVVDDDVVEGKNLGRIYNSSTSDVEGERKKVDVVATAIIRSGLPTRVIPLPKNVFDPDTVRQLAQCDVLFGCMDSVDGRDLVNRIAAFYSIPYFDLGVRLDADGIGGVSQVCATVHYLQPDGSSLLSRGVYTTEELRAAGLRRTNPEQYRNLLREKYIKGVNEERPAVISVNTLIASLGVNELLARLHPFRDDPNRNAESVTISLTQTRLVTSPESAVCPVLSRYAGRGDTRPLLNMPLLSERRD